MIGAEEGYSGRGCFAAAVMDVNDANLETDFSSPSELLWRT